ncbi:autotransporter outer membrane beta-barrel domain-containing protein [Enterobacter cloacae]|uniref:autotransporter outer membrane beta-barrel domain-containing protein n=1 Tax=Enterobacter cloacae TaxID=550 RepID=UPI0010A3D3AD|nr:autotransporter outer membrane beta-barrel domain-containing protein [Enterobacter cloacae]QCD10430.1 autotransporter outer membrane beta-barrel domain-containing protein [Enterobacter cloacae]
MNKSCALQNDGFHFSRLAIAIRNAIPALVLASLPVYADTIIDSQTSSYILSGPGPFVMPAPNDITVSSGSAISGDNSQNWLVTIDDGATVNGGSYGLNLGSASQGTVLNLSGDVTTTGGGSGGNAAGVKLNNGGTLNILSTGSIDSNSDGIFLTSGGTVNNSGVVSGADGGTSVYFSNGTGSYVGDSTSSIGGGYGIIVDSGTSTISNAGKIDLLHNGVWFRGSSSGSVDNQAGGIINSTSTSNYGIDISASGTVTISNEGSITGNTGILLGTSGHTLTNSGIIIGSGGTAISLTGNNNAVTLDTGSNITGNITATGTGNTLTLNGQGTLSSNVTGVQSITVAADVGQSWILSGSSTTTGITNQALYVQSGTLILNGALDNGGTGGGTTINGDAVLQLGNNSASGSVTGNIVDNGTLRFSRSDDISFANFISGSGRVNQAGSGQTTLTSANTYTGGTVVDAGTLNASDVDALGTGNVTINNAGTLDLSFTGDVFTNTITNNGVLDVVAADNSLDANISGTGENRVSALNTTFNGDNSGFSGLWNILSSGSMFAKTTQNLGDGAVQLAGILNVVPVTGGFLFSNALTGAGILKVELTSGNAFNFASSVGNLFTGTLEMGSGTFSLDGDNTLALTNSTLQLDLGGTTTVGAAQQNVGNLTLNGGILRFPDLPAGTINTGQLNMLSGTIRVDPDAIVDTSNLLKADDGAGVQLVTSTSNTGAASALSLQDLTGNTLTTSQANFTQGGNTVAVATYGDFGLTESGGLAVGYTLSQLDIQAGQTLTLSGDAATPSGAADMKALLSGSGNLAVNATDAITLTNAGNTYTGTTTVTGGTLRAGTLNVIDDSSQVTLNSGTAFDLNGFDQSVNNLSGAGNVTLGANTLTENTAGTVTYGGVISGTGAVTAAGTGTWILTGDNNWTGGTTIDSGVLQLGSGGTTGGITGDITNNGALVVNRSSALTLGGAIDGTGTLTQSGTGETTLSGANSYSGGTTVSAGTLNAASATALGTGDATVSSGATLDLSFTGGTLTNNIANAGLLAVTGANATLSGSITGAGENRISALNTTLSGDNTLFTGNWNITNGASANVTGGQNLGDAAVNLDGTLNIAPASGGYTFTNALTGGGLMTATVTGGNAFAFDGTVGSAFTGTLQLGQGTFALSGVNTTTLTNATLQLDGGNTTTVGSGTQTPGNLTLNGGTLRFANLASGVIATGQLGLTSGTVQIDPTQVASSGGSLLTEDDGSGLQLITATSTSGAASNLALTDLSGAALSSSLVNIDQNGATVAIGTYGYSLNNTNGLGVGYTLNQLDLQSGQTLTLSGDTATPAGASDMKALISGSGNLAIDATNALTLTNAGNTYTGTTTVTGGTLRAGALNVIDDSSQVTLNNGTTFDLNGFNQSVNNLTGTGNVTLGASTLTENTTGSVTYGGAIGGTGSVTTAGTGTWILTGNNAWTGGTTLSGGVLQLGAGGTSGSIVGNVVNNAGLVINRSDDVTLAGAISGSGTLTQNSSATGTTTLTGTNSYTGATTVQQGTLQLGNGGTTGSLAGTSAITLDSGAALAFNRSNAMTVANAITGDGRVTQVGSGTTVMSGTSAYTGGTSVAAGTLNAANSSALGSGAATVDSGASLLLSFSNGTFANAVANGGLLNVTGAGNTLNSIFTGTGENRISALNTTLGGDNTLFTGNWNIISSGEANVAGGQNLGDAAVNLDGTLNVAPASGNYTFTNTLTGSGLMTAALASGSRFAFDNTVGSAYTGTLRLGQSLFNLAGDNTAALTNATLQLDNNSETTVGAGTQTIGNLTMNGGALVFNGEVPPGQPDGAVAVGDLTLNSGEIRTEAPTAGIPNPAPTGQNLMEEDDRAILSRLVSASGTVTGTANNLTLTDHDGNVISDPQQFAITEGGTAVANATYNYALSTGTSNDGLYIQYGLTTLDLLSAQTLHLTSDAGATGAAATLSAQVTGVGNLDVDASAAGGQTVTLNNSSNNYTGTTSVSGGTLRLGSNQALGNTSLLTINTGANANINGMTQTIGALAGDGGLAINGGNLTISNGGTFGGVTSGALGNLTLTGGTLTLTGANTFTGLTTINSGAVMQVGAGGTTGSVAGPIADNGTLSFNRSDNVALTGAVSGSGELHQDGAGTLFINSSVGVTGPVVINSGTVSIGDGTTDGSVAGNIVNNSALQFNRSDWRYGGVISGAGTVEQVSGSQTTLTAANTYSGATTVSAGTLNAANVAALGTSAATVNSGATLALSFANGTFGNAVDNNGVLNISGAGNTLTTDITGTGTNRISALQTTIAGDNSAFNGNWDITGSGGATVTTQENLGGSPVQLNGILNVSPASGGFTFINALTGSGLLAATMGSISDAFNFAATAGNAFNGIVALRRGTMALEGDNTSALANATLSLGIGAIATLNSDQTIGNLTFNGGLLDVAMSTPSSANILTVNNLNVDSAVTPPNVGVVNLQTTSLPPGTKPDGNFLDQDNEVDNGIQLVKATTVSSEGTHLTLLLDGAAPADETDQVSDGFGHDDVLATYGYTAVMTAGANAPGGPGLYAGYMLKVLNSQSTAVIDTTGATDSTLGAQLTGVGDFEFRANDGTLTLANTANDYQGNTQVTSGTLLLGGNNTLGQTRALNIADGATTNLNGFSQSIGALNGAAGSTLALNGGALTVTNGGQSDGALTGGGNLNLTGGELIVTNANDALTATVDIDSGATARLKNAGGLGSGAVTLDGTLVLDTVKGSLANAVQGAGAMNLVNSSDVILTSNNAGFSGDINIGTANRLTAQQPASLGTSTLINNGELVLNASDNWAFANTMSGSGLLTKAGAGRVTLASDYAHTGGTHVESGTLALDNRAAALSGGGAVTVDEGATLGGYGKIVGNVTSRGTVSAGDAITSLTGGAGNLAIQGDLDNYNTVNLAGNSVGNTLTVTGNYTAHSTLVLNTVLGGDNSKTDKLVVQGDTSGHTDVYVNNKGGTGAQIVNGIRVIEVDGASNGDFTLANRVVAGAYDYQLLKGTPTSNDGDWYLRVPVEQPVVPIRPEAGAYLGNQSAAMDMFTHSLHDRLGESLFVTGNGQLLNAPSAWIRTFGSRTDSRSAGQIGQDTWSNGLQLGFDLASNLQVQNRWQVGVMAGYGSARTRNQSDGQSTVARSKVDGYSVGLYGTWFADGRPEGTGPYIDTWTQYGWYNNKVNGDDLPEQKYDSTTQAVSVEGGWAFNVYNTSLMSFFVQPQEQVIYTHYDADDVKEDNGTKVKMNDGGFSNRLGVRVYGYSADKKGRQWQPFIEANWLYNGYTDAVKMDSTRLESDTPKHRYEVKAGVEAKLSNQWSLWGNIGTQQGASEYRNVEGGLGVKYTW